VGLSHRVRRKLSRHRTTLEASADPVTVAAWMRDVPGRNGEAWRQPSQLPEGSGQVTKDQLIVTLPALDDMAAITGLANSPAGHGSLTARCGNATQRLQI